MAKVHADYHVEASDRMPMAERHACFGCGQSRIMRSIRMALGPIPGCRLIRLVPCGVDVALVRLGHVFLDGDMTRTLRAADMLAKRW